MRFFTIQWWRGDNDTSPFPAYQAHLDAIRPRLPRDLSVLIEHVSLHDAYLRELVVNPVAKTARVLLDGQADSGSLWIIGRKIELNYYGLTLFRSTAEYETGLIGPPGYGDLGYDEVDVIGDEFVHRMLFSTGIELELRFQDFKLSFEDSERPSVDDNLNSSDEDQRRWGIIEISKTRKAQYEPALIEMLEKEAESNRRHIVRALGNIGSAKSEQLLLHLLDTENGLILGDIAEALGKLRVADARMKLAELANNPIDWVANKSRWALKQITLG